MDSAPLQAQYHAKSPSGWRETSSAVVREDALSFVEVGFRRFGQSGAEEGKGVVERRDKDALGSRVRRGRE